MNPSQPNPQLDKISPANVAALAKDICSVGSISASWYNQPEFENASALASILLIIAANSLQSQLQDYDQILQAEGPNAAHQNLSSALQTAWQILFPNRPKG